MTVTVPPDPFAEPPPEQTGSAQPLREPGYARADAAPRNGLGTAALVLGILALVTSLTVIGGVALGIVAIVFGIIGRGRARRGEATNNGSATAGLALGAIALLLSIALVVFGVSLLNSGSGKKLKDCLSNAGQDQTAQQSCQQQFQKDFTK